MFEFGFYIKHFGSIEKDVFAKGKFGIRLIQEKEKKHNFKGNGNNDWVKGTHVHSYKR